MAFLDPKERVLEIILTEHGRRKLSQGKFRPIYFAFADDEVDYQTPNRSQTSSIILTASVVETFNYYLVDFNSGSFARSTEASWETASAQVYWWGSNERRVLANGDIVIENTRTNEFLNSENFLSSWTLLNNPAITGSFSAAPDGDTDTSRVEFNLAASEGQIRQVFAATIGNNVSASISIWAKSDAGAGDQGFELYVRDKTLVNHIAPVTTSEASFVRFSSSVGLGNGGNGPIAGFLEEGTNYNNGKLIMWGAQFEVTASFPSSYIRTIATTTRAADILSMSFGQWNTELGNRKYLISFRPEFNSSEMHLLGYNPTIFEISGGNNSFGRVELTSSGAGVALRIISQSVDILTSSTITFARNQQLYFTLNMSASGQQATIQSASTGDGTYGFASSGPHHLPQTGTLYWGCDNLGQKQVFAVISKPLKKQ